MIFLFQVSLVQGPHVSCATSSVQVEETVRSKQPSAAYCFSLTYLKHEDVEHAFCDLMNIHPTDPELMNFADYLNETDIDELEKATFLPTSGQPTRQTCGGQQTPAKAYTQGLTYLFHRFTQNICVFVKNPK